ncbi:MAG TPA: hypothetical protein VFA03_15790 [Acetobacteraceae bacterium]|nr:hypothetical protein [Acetobacteraceae bacterium]
MQPFTCELLALRPGGEIDLSEARVFIAPNLTIAIDQARQWERMEPWIGRRDAMLRLSAEGRPVWTRRLNRPAPI